jgi:hypothetical protein
VNAGPRIRADPPVAGDVGSFSALDHDQVLRLEILMASRTVERLTRNFSIRFPSVGKFLSAGNQGVHDHPPQLLATWSGNRLGLVSLIIVVTFTFTT